VSRLADGRPRATDYPVRAHTERLVLRRWEDDEADVYAALWSNPQVARIAYRGRPPEPGYGRRVFFSRQANWSMHGFGDWAVQDRASGELIGNVGLGRPGYVPGCKRSTDLGWLLRPSHWGRGLATEAARAVRDAAFRHLDLPELIAIIDPHNTPSLSVARRLAMREGAHVQFDHPHRGRQIVIVHTIDREQWSQVADSDSG
jgi:RimJ/RimL family protein N-acetyltransferase